MRIERVGLKYHCDITIFWQNVGHGVLADEDLAGCGILKPSDHAHRCRLSAPRGSKENKKFLVDHIEI
jgi:hypothetical protein